MLERPGSGPGIRPRLSRCCEPAYRATLARRSRASRFSSAHGAAVDFSLAAPLTEQPQNRPSVADQATLLIAFHLTSPE